MPTKIIYAEPPWAAPSICICMSNKSKHINNMTECSALIHPQHRKEADSKNRETLLLIPMFRGMFELLTLTCQFDSLDLQHHGRDPVEVVVLSRSRAKKTHPQKFTPRRRGWILEKSYPPRIGGEFFSSLWPSRKSKFTPKKVTPIISPLTLVGHADADVRGGSGRLGINNLSGHGATITIF